MAADVPEGVGTWLAESAAEADLSTPEFLAALAAALAETDEGLAGAESVQALEDELDEKVQDVRDRVIQVKRETDEKAPADHEHADLERDVAATSRAVADLEDDVAGLRDDLEATRATLDDGFENFEEVLDYLTETTDDLERKTRTLAQAVLDVREGLQHVVVSDDPVDDLARQANRLGVRHADCGDCGATVDVALLREAACPHCNANFAAVEESSRLFGWGNATLATGEQPPALEPADEDLLDDDADVAAIAGDGGERP